MSDHAQGSATHEPSLAEAILLRLLRPVDAGSVRSFETLDTSTNDGNVEKDDPVNRPVTQRVVSGTVRQGPIRQTAEGTRVRVEGDEDRVRLISSGDYPHIRPHTPDQNAFDPLSSGVLPMYPYASAPPWFVAPEMPPGWPLLMAIRSEWPLGPRPPWATSVVSGPREIPTSLNPSLSWAASTVADPRDIKASPSPGPTDIGPSRPSRTPEIMDGLSKKKRKTPSTTTPDSEDHASHRDRPTKSRKNTTEKACSQCRGKLAVTSSNCVGSVGLCCVAARRKCDGVKPICGPCAQREQNQCFFEPGPPMKRGVGKKSFLFEHPTTKKCQESVAGGASSGTSA